MCIRSPQNKASWTSPSETVTPPPKAKHISLVNLNDDRQWLTQRRCDLSWVFRSNLFLKIISINVSFHKTLSLKSLRTNSNDVFNDGWKKTSAVCMYMQLDLISENAKKYIFKVLNYPWINTHVYWCSDLGFDVDSNYWLCLNSNR